MSQNGDAENPMQKQIDDMQQLLNTQLQLIQLQMQQNNAQGQSTSASNINTNTLTMAMPTAKQVKIPTARYDMN